jgi:cytochrome c oxidase subunit 3
MIQTATTTTPPRVQRPSVGPRPAGGYPDDGRPSGEGDSPPPSLRTSRLGMIFALVGISMLFLGFTSAYIVRQGLGGDWQTIALPPILWLNTAVLLGSSVTLWRAGESFRRNLRSLFARWMTLTLVLGLGFLAGQLWAWHELRLQGIYLNTNPNSSFFYLLTGTHGLHLLGGVVVLLWLTLLAWRIARPGNGSARSLSRCRATLDVTTLYWHFLDGLWVLLVLLLFFWR